MENTTKFLLPSPNFDGAKKAAPKSRPHYLTPSGMTLLPREKQPPPMYGPRGATVPAKFLPNENKNKKFAAKQNEPQFCEPCEMELQSMEEFRLHRSQHKRCKIDGCNYNGHPSVMDKHIAALHTSGLFEKYRKLSTPEEIAAWREERRKRYPTVANAILRQKAHEQRQKRGERLEGNKSRFGKREDRNRSKHVDKQDTHRKSEHEGQRSSTPQEQRRNMKNIQRNNRRKKAKRCNEACNKTAKNEEEVVQKTTTTNASVPSAEMSSQKIEERFKGTKSMANYKHCKLKKAEVAKNALTGLLGMYGSDDDDESETESEEEDVGNCATNGAGENINGIQMETKAIEELNNAATAPAEEEINGKRMETTKEIQNIISETNSSTITLAPIPTESLCANVETCFQKDDKQPATTNKTAVRDQSTTKNNDSSDKAPQEAASFDKTSQIPYSGATPSEATAKNDDCSDEAPETATVFDKTCDPPNEPPTAKNDSSDEAPEEVAISKSSQIPDRSTPNEPPRKRAKPDEGVVQNRRRCLQSGLDYRKLRLRKQNTMLEKLLEPDIRHERNVLLQCVRFVCENNFFGIGAPKDNAGNKT